MNILEELVEETREFARARGWFAFHTPKNLSMAVVSEAGELAAEFRWLSEEASRRDSLEPERYEAIRLEMADVFIFLLRLGDVLDIDLAAAARDKLALKEGRFARLAPPIETRDLPNI